MHKFTHNSLVKLVFAALLTLLSCAASAEAHKEVQAALDWQLPQNSCDKPKLSQHDIRALNGIISQTPTSGSEVSTGTRLVFEVDHYKLARYERKNSRWKKCVSGYKTGLLEQFEVLKSSARYGLTEQQAQTIMGKLAQIQAAVVSVDGVAKEK